MKHWSTHHTVLTRYYFERTVKKKKLKCAFKEREIENWAHKIKEKLTADLITIGIKMMKKKNYKQTSLWTILFSVDNKKKEDSFSAFKFQHPIWKGSQRQNFFFHSRADCGFFFVGFFGHIDLNKFRHHLIEKWKHQVGDKTKNKFLLPFFFLLFFFYPFLWHQSSQVFRIS